MGQTELFGLELGQLTDTHMLGPGPVGPEA